MTIRRGERMAVVGANGAGKTTFIKLLLGLYIPTNGTIYVDGCDLQQLDSAAYQAHIAALFQDFHILAFSIAENVALSETAIDRERVASVLNMVNLSQRIDGLENGIDTPAKKTVEENGTEFSGGEAQRFALARALYKQADMYVMDEPSASLDPIEENRIYDMFARLMAGHTMIFVSHRLASTRFCDEILYFQSGNIAERGTHEKLMQMHGGYAEMYDAQAKFYQEQD